MYHVAFRQAPTRLSAGQTFEVELLRDAAHRVPDDVRIHFRYETGAESQEESEPMRLLNGAMVARKESVSRPFSYRAEGGDDQSMEWIRLEVVEPPRVESLKLVLHPPAYTGLPAAPSENTIQAMRGTRVAIAGTSTKKLRQATVCQEDGVERPATLTADAFGFTLAADAPEPFVVDKAGPYWIRLEDTEGQIGGEAERWEIRAVADLPPTLSLERPAGNVFVTPRGAVAVRIVAKDDLAIRDVSLHFSRSDNADVEDFTLPLYQGPATVAPPDPQAPPAAAGQAESRTVDHSWSLAELNLQGGTQITLWATAGDYLPQTGKSTVRRLTIISPAELEERLAQRQMLIFAELERVLKLQQDARGQTSSLEIQLNRVGQLAKQDVDHAQGAELNQRQVNRTLTSKAEGIPAQIDDFLADLASNQVDNPEMQRQMSAISDELARLGSEHLPTIERELTGVIKAAQAALAEGAKQPGEPGKPDPQIADSLANAGEPPGPGGSVAGRHAATSFGNGTTTAVSRATLPSYRMLSRSSPGRPVRLRRRRWAATSRIWTPSSKPTWPNWRPGRTISAAGWRKRSSKWARWPAHCKPPIRSRRPRSPMACTMPISRRSAGRCGRPAIASKRISWLRPRPSRPRLPKTLTS